MSGPVVAIVGCGLMGRWHAEYARRAGAEIVALVDRNEAAAQELVRRHPGARPVFDDASWLTSINPEVVHICTPTASHSALVASALDAGCHVLVEKPLARSVEESEALLDRAGRKGLRLSPVHQLPFQRGFGELRRDLPQLGEPLRADYQVFSAGGDGQPPEVRRGVLLEMLPHAASLFHGLGLSTSLSQWRLQRFDADQLELAALAGTVDLRILFSLSARPTRNELQVVGSLATATTDLFHGYCFLESGRPNRRDKVLLPFRRGSRQVAKAATNLLWRGIHRQPAYPGLPELIAAFYRSVTDGDPAVIDKEEILMAAALHELVAVRS